MIENGQEVLVMIDYLLQLTTVALLINLKYKSYRKKAKWHIKLGRLLLDITLVFITLLWVVGGIPRIGVSIAVIVWLALLSLTNN